MSRDSELFRNSARNARALHAFAGIYFPPAFSSTLGKGQRDVTSSLLHRIGSPLRSSFTFPCENIARSIVLAVDVPLSRAPTSRRRVPTVSNTWQLRITDAIPRGTFDRGTAIRRTDRPYRMRSADIFHPWRDLRPKNGDFYPRSSRSSFSGRLRSLRRVAP